MVRSTIRADTEDIDSACWPVDSGGNTCEDIAETAPDWAGGTIPVLLVHGNVSADADQGEVVYTKGMAMTSISRVPPQFSLPPQDEPSHQRW